MSIQLYLTRLKCILRNKSNLFWCYMFPVILASLFHFGFSNIWSAEDFDTIPIGYFNASQEKSVLKENLIKLEMSGTTMFSISEGTREELSKRLDDGEIDGYIIDGEKPKLYVREGGINETIMKSFLDSYLRISATVHTIMADHPQALNNGLMDDVMENASFTRDMNQKSKPDAIMIYFYALIAYTCLNAAFWGNDEANTIQADQSATGARLNVAFTHKTKLFALNLAAAFTAQCASVALLIVYLKYGLHINIGNEMTYIVATCIIGSLAGITLGAAFGIWVRKPVDVKEAILNGIVLGGAFLSGLMVADIKYIISDKAPILGYLNPVNLVTDSLYSLYYYDTHQRFIINTFFLLGMTMIFSILSYIGIRRSTYASI